MPEEPSARVTRGGQSSKMASQPPQVVVPAETKTPSEKDENEGLTDEEIRLKEDEDIKRILFSVGLPELIRLRPEIIDVVKDDLGKDLLAATQGHALERDQQAREIAALQRTLQLMREAQTREDLLSVGDSSTSSGTPEISTDEVIQRIHGHYERPPSGTPGDNHPSQDKLRAALSFYKNTVTPLQTYFAHFKKTGCTSTSIPNDIMTNCVSFLTTKFVNPPSKLRSMLEESFVEGALKSGHISPDDVAFLRPSQSTPTINLVAKYGLPCKPTGPNTADSVKPLPLVSPEPLTAETLLALYEVIDAHVLAIAQDKVKLNPDLIVFAHVRHCMQNEACKYVMALVEYMANGENGPANAAAMDALNTYNKIIASGGQPVSDRLIPTHWSAYFQAQGQNVSGLLCCLDLLNLCKTDNYKVLFDVARDYMLFELEPGSSAPLEVMRLKKMQEDIIRLVGPKYPLSDPILLLDRFMDAFAQAKFEPGSESHQSAIVQGYKNRRQGTPFTLDIVISKLRDCAALGCFKVLGGSDEPLVSKSSVKFTDPQEKTDPVHAYASHGDGGGGGSLKPSAQTTVKSNSQQGRRTKKTAETAHPLGTSYRSLCNKVYPLLEKYVSKYLKDIVVHCDLPVEMGGGPGIAAKFVQPGVFKEISEILEHKLNPTQISLFNEFKDAGSGKHPDYSDWIKKVSRAAAKAEQKVLMSQQQSSLSMSARQIDDSDKYPRLFPKSRKSRAKKSFSATSVEDAEVAHYKRLHEEFLAEMDRKNAALADKLAAEVTSRLVKTWGKESDWGTPNHASSIDGSEDEDDDEADEEEDSDQGGASVESE